MTRLVRAARIAHRIALVFVHKTLTVDVDMQERLAAGKEDIAAGIRPVEFKPIGQNGAIPNHGRTARLKLGARPQRHANAIAGFGVAVSQRTPVGIAGAQVLQHLVIRTIAARAHDNALRCIGLDNLSVVVDGNDAGHLSRIILHKLLDRRQKANLSAEFVLENIRHNLEMHICTIVRTFRVVLVKARVVAHGGIIRMGVVGTMPLEREEHALGTKRLLHPLNHFTGLFCPSLVEKYVRIARLRHVGMIQKRRNVLMMIGSEIGIERADCLACRRNSAALLEHENLGAFLGGRGCGGKAAVAGTDHNNIDVDGLIYFFGHGRLIAP